MDTTEKQKIDSFLFNQAFIYSLMERKVRVEKDELLFYKIAEEWMSGKYGSTEWIYC